MRHVELEMAMCYFRSMRAKTDVETRLTAFFSKAGRKPGCYNEAEFLEIEQADANALEAYAQHVLKVGPVENQGKEDLIAKVASWLSRHLTALRPEESRGQCRHASMVMMNVLENLGIWCFGINGSLSVYAPPVSRNAGHHFYIKDVEGKPGHTWIVAPPYWIVDTTAKFQGWPEKVKTAVPPVLLEREPTIEPPLLDRWLAPPLRRIPDARQAFQRLQQIFWTWLPCHRVEHPGVRLHYLPGGVTVPTAGEEPDFTGLKPSDILRDIRKA